MDTRTSSVKGRGSRIDLRTFSKVCTLSLQDGVRGLRELDDGLVEGGWWTDRLELHRVEEERRRAESADDCGWDLHAQTSHRWRWPVSYLLYRSQLRFRSRAVTEA